LARSGGVNRSRHHPIAFHSSTNLRRCARRPCAAVRRRKNHDNAETLKVCPSATSAAFSSSNVLSGLPAISARMRSACALIACERRSSPCSFGVTSPVSRACVTQRIALDAPDSKVRRSLSTRHTALNGGDHTPAKIDRKRCCYACRPPAPSRQFESLSA